MFEDWSLALHERRGKWREGDKDHAAPLGWHLTRSRFRSARCAAAALGVAVAILVVVSWQHLGELERLPLAPARVKLGPLLRSKALEAPEFNASSLEVLDHLVMVAGHAVVLAETLDHVDTREDAWYLETYQRGQDVPTELVSHIRQGVRTAAADPRALLVFSGGQTRPRAGPRDEGSSYYRVAEHYHWWAQEGSGQEPGGLPVSQRAVVEDFASDSFQNLLFSLCRFKEVVGSYPARITVVSFSFKRRRFQELHRGALRFPLQHFSYKGLEPSGASHFDLQKAERGERENSVRFFETDPFGCHSPALQAKRRARNPFRRTIPYPLSCPELAGLLSWCGPGPFPDALPWDSRRT